MLLVLGLGFVLKDNFRVFGLGLEAQVLGLESQVIGLGLER